MASAGPGAGLLEELAFHSFAPFTVAARVGTPPQDVRLLLDTSSGITWVFGSNCSSCDRGAPRYAAGASSSAAQLAPHFSLQLLHGSGLEGRVVSDAVSVGPLSVAAQPVAVVERVLEARDRQKAKADAVDDDAQGHMPGISLRSRGPDDDCFTSKLLSHVLQPCQLRASKLLLQAGASGVLGMGRSSIAGRDRGEPASLFDSLVLQGSLPDDVFTLDMSPMAGKVGSLHLGGAAPQGTYAGRVRYYNCSDAQRWQLSFESVHVRARPPPGSRERVARAQFSGHYCLDGPRTRCEASLSSGSAFVVGPAASVASLLLELQVDTDCHNLDRLPSLFFRVLGHDYEVAPSEYVLRIAHEGRTKCVAAVLPHRDEANRRDWLLGAPFFRRHVVVFDRRRHRIGIAEKASAASDRRGAAPDDDYAQTDLSESDLAAPDHVSVSAAASWAEGNIY